MKSNGLIYENTFLINNIEDSNNEIVKTFIANNNHSSISMQYHSHLLNLENIKNINLIIYKNCLNEELVPEKYQYLTQGPIYNIEENNIIIKINVSFHGLLFEMEINKNEIDSVTDSDILMVGISKKI